MPESNGVRRDIIARIGMALVQADQAMWKEFDRHFPEISGPKDVGGFDEKYMKAVSDFVAVMVNLNWPGPQEDDIVTGKQVLKSWKDAFEEGFERETGFKS